MTAKKPTYFKLGIFVLVSIAVAFIGAAALGARVVDNETVRFHVFFDESVQGLEVGAPVKYRGVNVGVVAHIDIAPDRRHVDVTAELDVDALRRMGLTEDDRGGRASFPVPPDLRAQLGMQGITGVKFVLIDFFDPVKHPPRPLPFDPPENTIPAATSLLKSVENSLPEVADQLSSILKRIDRILASLEKNAIAEKVVALVDELTGAVTEARSVISAIDRDKIPARLARTLDNADAAFAGIDRTMTRINADDGLVASAQRATDSFTELGETATTGTRNLSDTLEDVSEAAQAIRRLADALERDPDMLLKGRSREEKR